MRQKLLFLKMLAVGVLLLMGMSAKAINNNVELIANGDFSGAALLSQSAIAVDATTGAWIAGDNTKTAFTPSISGSGAAAYFTSTATANSTYLYDHFLGQITADLLTTGRYRISLKAMGDQPFYLKISGTNALGTEYTSVVKNAVGSVDRTGTGSYSIKFTPASASAFGTIQADLDITIPTSATARMYFVFPTTSTVALDDISLKRTADIPSVTTFFVRPTGNTTAWTGTAGVDADQIITGNALSLTGTNIYYIATGSYTTTGITMTSGKIYGGFSGNESTYELSTRVTSDLDSNGNVEPWEFTNEASITSSVMSSKFTDTPANVTRLLVVSGNGGEVNGVTLTDFTTNYTGPITIGKASTSPLAADTVSTLAGTLRLCTIKKIKSVLGGAITITNPYSLIDRCLIESTVNTLSNSGGAINMLLFGGLVEGCVIRNNVSSGTGGRGGAIYVSTGAATGNAGTVRNCLIYNNASTQGGAIRIDGQAGKRGVQIVNSTIVNNKSGIVGGTSQATVEFVNCGLITNSIVVNPALTETGTEIRATTANSYIANTVYGDSTYTTGGAKLNTMRPKISSDLAFKNPTTFSGVSIPDYTTPWDATAIANYNAIRQSNFAINNTSSPAVIVIGASSLPTTYTYTTGTVSITATVPTTDITGLTRTGAKTLGAYQATGVVSNAETLTITQPSTMVTLTVNSGGTVTINAGKQLTVNTTFSNSGTLNLLSSSVDGTATILTPATIGGTGATYNVQQYVSSNGTTGVNARNWYVSSPLSDALSSTITNATGNGLVYYDGTTNWPAAPATLVEMKGYIAKAPAQNTTINFTGGTLNTGDKSVSSLPLGFNLVGNPYASYVDFSQATITGITNSIWYRSKSTGSYVFQTYNVPSNIGANDGTAIIPPMQSFWIKTTSTTNTLAFTNTMRSHQNQSVTTNRLKAPKVSNQQLLRIKISNGTNNDETVVYFNENAQNNIDDYDTQKMFNNITDVPEIYSQMGTDKLVINGMNSVPYNIEIPLGFSTLQANNFTIKASEIKNFEVGTSIILRDKVNVVDYELNADNAYTFTSDAVNTTSRFSLIFRTFGSATGVENTVKPNAQVFVNTANQITIIAPERSNYVIYNAMGQLIENGVITSNSQTSNFKLASGVYVVRVNENGKSNSTRVILNGK